MSTIIGLLGAVVVIAVFLIIAYEAIVIVVGNIIDTVVGWILSWFR